MSKTHSMASHRTHATGSSVSQLSVESSRPGRYRASSKTKEDMALIKGQMASMQEAIQKLSSLPALIASIPTISGRKDSSQTEPGSKESESTSESGQGSDARVRHGPREAPGVRQGHESGRASKTESQNRDRRHSNPCSRVRDIGE